MLDRELSGAGAARERAEQEPWKDLSNDHRRTQKSVN
jgi:hypothetical protein